MVVNWSYNHRTDEIAQREHILTIALLVQTETPPPPFPPKERPSPRQYKLDAVFQFTIKFICKLVLRSLLLSIRNVKYIKSYFCDMRVFVMFVTAVYLLSYWIIEPQIKVSNREKNKHKVAYPCFLKYSRLLKGFSFAETPLKHSACSDKRHTNEVEGGWYWVT